MQKTSNQSRLFCLDFLKAISIVAVVSFHSIFVPNTTYQASAEFLESLFTPLRFCVPVFLTISFLLFARQLENSGNQKFLPLLFKRLQRLLIPTVFWFTLAAVLKLANGNSLIEIRESIHRGTIFTGSYYLLVILQLFPIFLIIRRWLYSSYNLIFAIILQWLIFVSIYVGLSNNSYSPIIEFIKNIDRPLFIYWLVYMAIGTFIYTRFDFIVSISKQITLPVKVFLICAMSTIFMFDYQWLISITNGAIQPFDYATISCILSVAIMFICFASVREINFPRAIELIIKLLSKYSLGIFCINGILSQLFLSLGTKLFNDLTFSFIEILVLKITGWAILLLISLFLSILIARIGLKQMVC